MTGVLTSPDEALVEALMRVEGKAEIIDGKIVHFPLTGTAPNYAAFEIAVSLRTHARAARRGRVATDGLGFLVKLPRRRSFAPDAAYWTGPSGGMKFVDGTPDFAVEVRSEGDYGPAAEREMASKRRDYFAAGTLVVWDVDLESDDVVRLYRDGDGDTPAAVFRRGELAHAEPAVSGWTMPVDDLFEPATTEESAGA